MTEYKGGVAIRAGCAQAPSWSGVGALDARTRPIAATMKDGSQAWLWVGLDDRGRELEVIAVEVQGPQDLAPVLLVIHVIPTHFKKEES